MLDQWFLKDINAVLDKKSIVVLVDESGQAGFLLDCLSNKITVHHCQNELEELHVKYLIEKGGEAGTKHLIYTNTGPDKLCYVREYCETHGMVPIKYLQNYIKGKVHRHLGLNLILEEQETISAGKISIGKDQTYWMDLCHKGATQIFDLEKELVAFLDQPKAYTDGYDNKVRAVFYEKVHKAIGEQLTSKPAATLAKEVAKKILDGLLKNDLSPLLEKVYYHWLDSKTYSDSFPRYLATYKVPASIDIWGVHPSHPFSDLDKRQLQALVGHLQDKGYLKEKKTWIKARRKNRIAQQMGINWWSAVLCLLDYNTSALARLDSLAACIKHYLSDFYQIDRAIRELYTDFLADREIIRPLQEYYQHHLLSIFLDKWFKYIPNYSSNQQGVLSRLIDGHDEKIAIVVGDGISYEYALQVKDLMGEAFHFAAQDQSYMLADFPTETENNMSRIYVASGAVFAVHKQREKHLLDAHPEKDIGFLQLEQVNESTDQHHYLICSYKDLDELGEKQQQRALKYFAEMAKLLAAKMGQLLRNGYQKVFLLSDHGFVLSGLLAESDKIVSQVGGNAHASERYIRSVANPGNDNLITFAQTYRKYEYISFSKNIGPFKTPGVYGYSHGGLTPQEVITPYFCWEAVETTPKLMVSVVNKADLKSAVGNVFSVKIQGIGEKGDLFQAERKVQLLLFFAGKQIMKSDIMTIRNQEQLKKEFDFDGKDTLELRIIDALTKETLDSTSIKQDHGRDLGGLL